MAGEFLPAGGFDTYEEQDKVLAGLTGSDNSRLTVQILQQQGFAVSAAVFTTDQAALQRAKDTAVALGVELLWQKYDPASPAEAIAALDELAQRQGLSYLAAGLCARVETQGEGFAVLPAMDPAADESALLAGLPAEVLAKLILPLGEFDAEGLAALREELKGE